jgi:hypothetical protein
MSLNKNQIIEREPISRAFDLGKRSIAITIAKKHVRHLHISNQTYFRQKVVPEGILLELLELHSKQA